MANDQPVVLQQLSTATSSIHELRNKSCLTFEELRVQTAFRSCNRGQSAAVWKNIINIEKSLFNSYGDFIPLFHANIAFD